jgi:hypothetical protein
MSKIGSIMFIREANLNMGGKNEKKILIDCFMYGNDHATIPVGTSF